MRYLIALSLALPILLLCGAPAAAKDSLGVFGDWGAFRDPDVPRCYAIATAEESSAARAHQPFASVGTWPGRQVRGQFHIRLSRDIAEGGTVRLRIGNESFSLAANGSDAWASNAQMDARIVAALRAASAMLVSARDAQGRNFTDRYGLNGAATALDAASVGCSRVL